MDSKLPQFPWAEVSRPAWEKRFGKPLNQARFPNTVADERRLADVSHEAWCKRHGHSYELDRRFKNENSGL